MKKFAFIGILAMVSACLVSGLYLWAELAFRALGYTPNRGALIDATLFTFAPYTVSSHPPNTVLGLGRNILDAYYSKDECLADDGGAARFNSLGFRGPEFPPPGSKRADELRVLISGGSASISWNIGEKCTLDALLQQRLETLLPGRRISIYNLGNGAWKSFQELVAMELFGLELEPDVVVHFSGFNDAFHAFSMPVNQAYSAGMINLAFQRYEAWLKGTPGGLLAEFRIGSALKTLLSPKPKVLDRPEEASPTAPELAAKPQPGGLATRPSFPLDLDAIAKRGDFDPYNRQVVDNYLKNERLMSLALSTKGAVLVSALQPALYLKQPFSESEARMLTTGYGETVNFTVQAYLRLRQDLAALADRDPNVRFIDLSAPFNGSDETHFGDNVHFRKGGYRIVADRLAPVVAEAILLKKR